MGAITAQIFDLDSNLLSDISSIALEKSMSRLLNGPRIFTIQSIANRAEFTDTAGGVPILHRGDRKLIVWEDGITLPIFHGRIFGVERKGTGGTKTPVTITAMDQWMELGYDADDRGGRPVRDGTGNFINPSFVGTGTGGPDVTSGADLVRQVLTNSQGTDDESGTNPGEGPLAIDLATGPFDLDVPPAIDLSCEDTMDWPVMCGDFINQLVQTGVLDVEMRPVDPSEGFDPNIMVSLSAQSRFGSDKSGTVHFDYVTGSKNASECRHVEDFATICNKLYDYLGPRISQTRWRGNITPGSPGTTVDPSASRTRYANQFFSLRVFDSVGSESSARPLYIAAWNAEQAYRMEPRDLLFITPDKGGKALFEALKDFDAGDDIALNVGATMGITLAESQRVYGFTKTWSRQNVSQVSELLTSADVTI